MSLEMNDEAAYYILVVTGERTINDVPISVRSRVIELLEEAGYNELLESDSKFTNKDQDIFSLDERQS